MSTKPTRLEALLAATARARALVAGDLRVLERSHRNGATGEIMGADAIRLVAKYRRTLKQVDAALAAYGITT